MAKGYDQHKERQHALSIFGKDLTRRARASCELCETNGVALSIYEVPPVPELPALARCIFICDACREQLERPKAIQVEHWRCLHNTLWSEVPAVQVVALRMLKHLGKTHVWATELLEQAYPDPEVEAWSAECGMV